MAISAIGVWDKDGPYNQGDTITGTITGDDVHTVTTQIQTTLGPVVVPVKSGDGDSVDVTFDPKTVLVPHTEVTHDSVVIDVAAFNPNQGGRTWAVTSPLTISATA